MTGVEWHTAGRRQPEIFGKDMAGRRLIGGPYTSVQAGLMAVIAVVMWLVAMIFRQSTSVTVGLVVGATLVGYYVGRRLDLSNGNPYFAVSGFCRAMITAASARRLLWARGCTGAAASRPAPAAVLASYSPVVMQPVVMQTVVMQSGEPDVEAPVIESGVDPQLAAVEEEPALAAVSPSAGSSPLAAFLAAAGQKS